MARETRQNGSAIRAIREMRGLSRNSLAAKIGKSYSYYCNIENEHKEPTAEMLHSIAMWLDVPVAALLRRGLYEEEST